jgi:hypothetical protein
MRSEHLIRERCALSQNTRGDLGHTKRSCTTSTHAQNQIERRACLIALYAYAEEVCNRCVCCSGYYVYVSRQLHAHTLPSLPSSLSSLSSLSSPSSLSSLSVCLLLHVFIMKSCACACTPARIYAQTAGKAAGLTIHGVRAIWLPTQHVA